MFIFVLVMFCISPIISLPLILFCMIADRKSYLYRYAFLLAVDFGVLAYCFEPSHEMDLTRYFDILKVVAAQESFFSAKEYMPGGGTLIVQDLFFYLIAKTGEFHLLPLISMFITYAITFYICIDFGKYEGNSRRATIYCLLFIISTLPFPYLISNIRNIMAIAIFLLAIYRELVQNKKNMLTIFLYLISVFTHFSILVLIIIRILLPFYRMIKKKYVFLIVIFMFVCMNAISNLHIISGSGLIQIFINKVIIYLNSENSDYALRISDSIAYSAQKFFFISIVVFLLFIILTFNKKANKFVQRNRDILSFIEMSGLLSIVISTVILPIYMRFAYIVLILSFVVNIGLFKYGLSKKFYILNILIEYGFILGGLIFQIILILLQADIKISIENIIKFNVISFLIGG